ncbi:LacI family DNA-binding transcriptional regulator [Aquisalimonas lutea]|uniref:LacI family DNA-binding transcriptional regulator n=1 Tax=Aquisalimonas lutea TaxID=1327750 RepID=UPI0025B48024|nr:LacI family DNA-binding transcriptional regulator [Aquisalimonas lutea]MDN3516475.1 LacI family DNA-binding transcriptional regulator [Aquisalimonas lutea]
MERKSAVRMEDVARLAGVSSITVSRVLNHPDKVAEGTRERVLAAVEATGYIPNSVAGSLASRRTRVIGALVPTITNSIFADTIDGMDDVLRPAGYQLLLGATGYSLDEESRLISAMLAQRPAGLLATGLQHQAQAYTLLRATEIPIVETWNVDGDPVDMAVGFSNFRACHAMVTCLAEQGARRIGFVSAPTTANDRAEQRLLGYRRAVRDLGLDADPALEREAKFSFHAGAERLLELLAARPDVEAIFFANDILALGALFECQRRGIRVPEDLAIAGFDDVELAAQVNPGLTTVRIPRYGIGRQAAHMILRRIEGGVVDPSVVDLGFEIVQRASTPAGSAAPA